MEWPYNRRLVGEIKAGISRSIHMWVCVDVDGLGHNNWRCGVNWIRTNPMEQEINSCVGHIKQKLATVVARTLNAANMSS